MSKKKNHEVLKQFAIWKAKELPEIRETFTGNEVLIELFKYEPKEDKNIIGASKTILVKDEKGGYKDSKVVYNARYLPIARIVQLGEGFEGPYKVGDYITVPSSDVNGPDQLNPDYVTLMQSGKSNMEALLPAGFRKKISSLEYKWDRYRYYDPFDFDTDKETRLYIIPSLKIRGKWNG